jgi:membrane protein
VFALWTATGAMTAFMRALNRAYEVEETRNFARQRLVALEMLAVMFVAFVLVFGLLVLGPHVSSWIGSAVDAEGLVGTVWWIAQWPVLLLGLLAAFATVLYLGPNVEQRKWQFLTPGALTAAVVWIVVSGLFAVYTAKFGSYNKTWGSFSAVIVMLTWLWLSGLALLLGAEINSEVERSRRLRSQSRA